MKKVKGRQGEHRWVRSAGIVTLFAVMGPLAGLATFMVWFVLLTIASAAPTSFGDLAEGVMPLLRVAFFGMIFGLPSAYSFGFPAAVAVGVVMALWDWRFGVLSWLAVGGAAFAVWLVPFLFWGDQFAADGIRLSRTSGMLPAYIGAAIVCTWTARRPFGSVRSSDGR